MFSFKHCTVYYTKTSVFKVDDICLAHRKIKRGFSRHQHVWPLFSLRRKLCQKVPADRPYSVYAREWACAKDERNTTMNKAIQKMIMALAVCGALCGTAMAAPKGSTPPRGKAPTAMKAPVQKSHAAKAPASARHTATAPVRVQTKTHIAPVRPEPRHEVARHAPPPPPVTHRHEPRHHHSRHSGTLHTDDWCEIGASLLGGLVGGLIGASI